MTGYLCKYTPVAVLAGFGVPYERLNPVTESFAASDGVTHQNLCCFAKSFIGAALAGGADELVLTNCCDSIRRACDVLREFGQLRFLHMVDLPHCVNACARELFAQEILRLIDKYAAYSGKPFSIALALASIVPPPAPSAEPYVSVLGARVSEELLSAIQGMAPLPVRNGTCTAAPALSPPAHAIGTKEEFAAWYADALLVQTGCMRMDDTSARRAVTQDPNLRGVIYNTVKFCDYYHYDYLDVRRETQLPTLKIETDYTTQSLGQLRTRVEAFFETMQPRPAHKRRNAMEHANYFAGIDSGSSSTDVVILDREKHILAHHILPTGAKAAVSSESALSHALEACGLSDKDIAFTITTGYGRTGIEQGDSSVTEITCHAKGAHFLYPQARTVIDIGGQDSKVICLDKNGAVKNFVMNDKCAAGTGRFLETMAGVLNLPLEEMSVKGLAWHEEIKISNMCTVFAESEVVSLIAQNKRTADIVHALSMSVASKTAALVKRAGGLPAFIMTGGVAKNRGVVTSLEVLLGQPLFVSELSQLCGAVGAALIALEQGS